MLIANSRTANYLLTPTPLIICLRKRVINGGCGYWTRAAGEPGNVICIFHPAYSFKFLRRNALTITDTELKVIAALAIIGLRSKPKTGNRTPAAIGTPTRL